MNSNKIAGIVRHAVALLGAVFIGANIVSADEWTELSGLLLKLVDHAEDVAGVLMILWAFYKSITAPEKAA